MSNDQSCPLHTVPFHGSSFEHLKNERFYPGNLGLIPTKERVLNKVPFTNEEYESTRWNLTPIPSDSSPKLTDRDALHYSNQYLGKESYLLKDNPTLPAAIINEFNKFVDPVSSTSLDVHFPDLQHSIVSDREGVHTLPMVVDFSGGARVLFTCIAKITQERTPYVTIMLPKGYLDYSITPVIENMGRYLMLIGIVLKVTLPKR